MRYKSKDRWGKLIAWSRQMHSAYRRVTMMLNSNPAEVMMRWANKKTGKDRKERMEGRKYDKTTGKEQGKMITKEEK